jgi:hypothetical protein
MHLFFCLQLRSISVHSVSVCCVSIQNCRPTLNWPLKESETSSQMYRTGSLSYLCHTDASLRVNISKCYIDLQLVTVLILRLLNGPSVSASKFTRAQRASMCSVVLLFVIFTSDKGMFDIRKSGICALWAQSWQTMKLSGVCTQRAYLTLNIIVSWIWDHNLTKVVKYCRKAQRYSFCYSDRRQISLELLQRCTSCLCACKLSPWCIVYFNFQ